ncbi:MAG: AI-2E family transporter [Rhodocyclaceae bacterium]|nr:AI-2E family transporter [Rhodocyclaceae bacterium]
MPLLQSSFVLRVLLLLIFAAAVFFFHRFLVPVLAALIIGFASWPLYRRLQRRCSGRTALAASIALLVVVLAIILPLGIALLFALSEAQSFILWLQHANTYGSTAPEWIASLPGVGSHLANYWDEHLGEPQALAQWFEIISGEHIGNIYRTVLTATSRFVSIALSLLFMLITLFFVYKDGAALVRQIDRVGERLLPTHWQRFSRVIPATVSATVAGMGLIAVGEGVVLGTAYWIAGVPSPILLGAATAFMAMIPGGAPLSFTLVSLYLIGAGKVGAGIGLFAWGTCELFIVDKTLRPRLVGGPVKLPFLPTFFGLVGGVQTLGVVGLFIGPVLMALLVAFWREWVRSLETPDYLAALPPPGALR